MSVNSKELRENGTQFYPVTHIEAVIDGNGGTLDQILEKKNVDVVTHPYTDATVHGLPNFQTGIIDTSIPNSYKCSDYIDITDATGIVYTNLFPMQQNPSGNKWSGLVLYDSNKGFVVSLAYNSSAVPVSGTVDLSQYPTAKYVIFAPFYDSGGNVDTSAEVEITYIHQDDLLYESDIANDYLGGVDRALSAEKGKELHDAIELLQQAVNNILANQ